LHAQDEYADLASTGASRAELDEAKAEITRLLPGCHPCSSEIYAAEQVLIATPASAWRET